MPDEKIESARAVRDAFINELDKLKTYEDYRNFVLRFFNSVEAFDRVSIVIDYAEMKGIALSDIGTEENPRVFEKMFRSLAYSEFFKGKDRFQYEEIKLGFMR
jgi:hypothetical protein